MVNINQKYFFKNVVHVALCCLFLLLGCDYFTTSKKYNIVIDDSYVGGIGFWKKHALLKELNEAIENVTQYFDTTYSDTLTVYIFEKGSEGIKNVIHLGKNNITYKENNIYETTHVVLGVKPTRFEYEGLAVFMAFKFTNGETPKDVKKLKWQYLGWIKKRDCSIYSLKFMLQNNSPFLWNAQTCAYIQAGSFYQFLEDRYGKTKLKEFYLQGPSKIDSIYGVSVDSLDSAWRTWLLSGNEFTPDSSDSK